MEERALDQNDVDDVQSDEGGAQAARQRESVGLGYAGMLGGIDADHNALDHRTRPSKYSPAISRVFGCHKGFFEMGELRGSARIASLVEELAQAAERVGLQVRRERLLREVGYRARGGACRLRERDLLIIDSAQPPAEQLEVLLEALRTRDLETLYLSPAARRLLRNQADQSGGGAQSD